MCCISLSNLNNLYQIQVDFEVSGRFLGNVGKKKGNLNVEIITPLLFPTDFISMQCTVEEFNLDVDAIFDLVLLDPKFEGLIQNITHLSAAEAIQEAMNILHSNIAPNKGVHCDVSPEGCLVIAILQQWLVRYLCKRLMQLMTPEALILQRNKIPSSYFKNYLNFHTHFSLHKLVESFHKASDSTQKYVYILIY